MPRVRLTPGFVKTATCHNDDRELYWHTGLPGFGLAVTVNGHKSYCIQFYDSAGVEHRMAIGDKRTLTLTQALKLAKKHLGAVAGGADPLAERRAKKSTNVTTLKAVAEDYFRRQPNRSTAQWRANMERLVYPVVGRRSITDFNGKRGPIIALIDDIKDERGPGMAKVVRTNLSTIFNWYSGRVDGFANPLTRGVAAPDKYQPRDRILSDDEIVRVERTAETFPAPWGCFVRFQLRTACRRTEASAMRWDELDGDTWIIPGERSKTKSAVALPLSAAAQSLLASLPRVEGCPYVFTITGRAPIAGFSRFKKEFDEACGVSGWTLHDLRRTARSLLSRAGVSPDTAERCLGHKLTGVRGTYDRHTYHAEMLHGFTALAALIDRIVNPPADIVTPLRTAKP